MHDTDDVQRELNTFAIWATKHLHDIAVNRYEETHLSGCPLQRKKDFLKTSRSFFLFSKTDLDGFRKDIYLSLLQTFAPFYYETDIQAAVITDTLKEFFETAKWNEVLQLVSQNKQNKLKEGCLTSDYPNLLTTFEGFGEIRQINYQNRATKLDDIIKEYADELNTFLTKHESDFTFLAKETVSEFSGTMQDILKNAQEVIHTLQTLTPGFRAGADHSDRVVLIEQDGYKIDKADDEQSGLKGQVLKRRLGG